jgi:hypothetical protein
MVWGATGVLIVSGNALERITSAQERLVAAAEEST